MRRSMMPPLLLLLAAALAGCAAGPDYVRPALEAPVPAAWQGPAAPGAVGGADAARWWRDFGEPELDALVAEALSHNLDLALAAGRVLEARALLGGAKAAQFPAVEIGGSASRVQNSEALSYGFTPPITTSYGAMATLRWEADLWGRLSRSKQAAWAALLAGEEDRRTVTQAVIADVVRTWLQVRELSLQVLLNERTVANFASSLTMVSERYERGLVSSLDVHLAAQNLAAARAAGPALVQELAAARRRLEILAGRYPAGAPRAAAPDSLPAPLPPVPAGLPGELLERRPDLLAAELRLRAAVANIGAAKAALYPRLSLTADAGSKSRELADLFTDPTDAWSLVGNLVMPLFNRGAAKSQAAAAEARAQQAVAAYRAAVLRAFGEVENALDEDLCQARREGYLIDSVEQARRSVEAAQDRYRRGLDNLLVTLEAQRRLYTAESQLLTTQRVRRAARVNLIQALGGPWDPARDTQQGAAQ